MVVELAKWQCSKCAEVSSQSCKSVTSNSCNAANRAVGLRSRFLSTGCSNFPSVLWAANRRSSQVTLDDEDDGNGVGAESDFGVGAD